MILFIYLYDFTYIFALNIESLKRLKQLYHILWHDIIQHSILTIFVFLLCGNIMSS